MKEKSIDLIIVFRIFIATFAPRREVLLSNSYQSAEIGTVANSLPDFLQFFPTSYF